MPQKKTWTLAPAATGDSQNFPYTSPLQILMQIAVTGDTTVALQCSLNDGTTWANLPNATGLTSTFVSLSGPYERLRPVTTGTTGGATIHCAWSWDD